MANFRNRPNGRVQVQIRRNGINNLTKTFSNRKEADLWAIETETAIDRGIYQDTLPACTATIKEICDRYRDEIIPHLRGGNIDILRLKRLSRKLGGYSLSNLHPPIIAKYRDSRLLQVKPATVKKELGLLRRIINTAIKDWHYNLSTNPVSLIRLPCENNARTRRLEKDEADSLEKSLTNPNIRTVVQLALETAARRSEIAAMTIDNLDLDKRTWHIPDSKNGCARVIPLSGAAVAILRKHIEEHSIAGGRLFSFHPPAITKGFIKACRKAGIDGLRFHDLRHEATSRLFEKGLSILEVATITGHKDIRMLSRYTHLKAEDIAMKL